MWVHPCHLALQTPVVVHMPQRLLPFITALRESKAIRNSLSPARIYTTSLVLGFPGFSLEATAPCNNVAITHLTSFTYYDDSGISLTEAAAA